MKIKLAFIIWENWNFCQEQVVSFVLIAQIKMASFIIIVTDQTCQFYPQCCSRKKNSLIMLVPDNKCQFYLHCQGSKLLSIIFIVTNQNCQLSLYCHRSKLPVSFLMSQIRVLSLLNNKTFSTGTIRKKLAILIFDNEDKTSNLNL